MAKPPEKSHRLDRQRAPSVRSWQAPTGPEAEQMQSDVAVDMGWGRLIFGQTFESNERLAETVLEERPGQRDIVVYLRDPHVVLSLAPQELFLDPSHTYRLWSHDYRPRRQPPAGFVVRRLRTREDAGEINRIYAARQMVTCDPEFLMERHTTRLQTYFVAESEAGEVVGTVTGVDHVLAFDDPEKGASLWCLAVDPQAQTPGVGEGLTRHLVEHYFARGRDYVDLSVMHDNQQAIRLYEKLGFRRVPAFTLKRKNPINEALFTGPEPESELNPYARIVVDEARRRGIGVDILDAEQGYFALRMGGREIVCRESLSELTHAVAMSRCDDKRVTHRVLEAAGLAMPDWRMADGGEGDAAFLAEHGRVVVKPVRGEQGAGVSVDVEGADEMRRAVDAARGLDGEVLIEEMRRGEDLRLVVIDGEVVAAAVRRPPAVVATGSHSVRELVAKYNRRRAAATGGESEVPLDDETARCLADQGLDLDATPEEGREVTLRRAANLHTGGTIHDVTADLHPELATAAVAAAEAIDIPVVGLDLIVESVDRPEYVIVEANERVGLANHEPQPTAERFVDLLFPQSRTPGGGPGKGHSGSRSRAARAGDGSGAGRSGDS